MGKFSYQVKNAAGQIQSGTMDAQDEAEVRVKLRAKDLTILRIVGNSSPALLANRAKKVSKRELQIFTRQFSTLVNAGIPIVDALKMLGEGGRNKVLTEAATTVRLSIESGRRLAESMAAFPGVFDRLYINMVRAGEEAGILDAILDRLAIYIEKSEKIRKQITGAMAYPVMIIFVAVIVITGILVFIIPKFQELYKGSGSALPAMTQIVVNLSKTIVDRWVLILALLFFVPYLLISYIQTAEGAEDFDRITIQLPIFGDVVQKSALAKMSRTLATLLSSGVSVIDAMEIASRTSGNRVIEEALVRSKESVITGKPLAAPLAKEKMIPIMVTQMISIGEKSGTLDIMFGKIADFYEDDVENAIKAMLSMIEPLLMVILGGIIAFLVLAMYLPIFGMADAAAK